MGLSRDGSADRRTTTLWAWEARWWASPPTVMPAQALSSDQRAVTSGRRTRSAATRATCGNSSTTGSTMGVHRTAVAPVAIDVGLDRRPQVPPVVVGPQLVLEDHLGVGALPEQEVARALFAGGPHEEVDVRHPRLGQVPGHGALVDRPRPEPPAGDVLGDPLDSIPDLGPAPVVHAEVQGEAGVVPRQLLRRLELPDHRAPEPGSSTHPAHPYPPVVELVATPSSSAASPASWPLVRGRPRELAQRPLPSMTMATWRGIRSRAMAGGRAPDGWGKGGGYGLALTVPPFGGSGSHVPGATGGRRRSARSPPDGAGGRSRRRPPSSRPAGRPGEAGSRGPGPPSRAAGTPDTLHLPRRRGNPGAGRGHRTWRSHGSSVPTPRRQVHAGGRRRGPGSGRAPCLRATARRRRGEGTAGVPAPAPRSAGRRSRGRRSPRSRTGSPARSRRPTGRASRPGGPCRGFGPRSTARRCASPVPGASRPVTSCGAHPCRR